MRKIELKLRYFYWSLKRSLEPNLFYDVKYKGINYHLKEDLNKIQSISLINTKTKEKDYYHINRKDVSIIFDLHSFFNSFMFYYRFQIKNWYSIDVYNKLFTKNIYNGR